jgi:dTDP-4-dehydrorhamnose 3,5-epimerase-like enzyme
VLFQQIIFTAYLAMGARIACDFCPLYSWRDQRGVSERGFFLETYLLHKYWDPSIALTSVQDNHARSVYGINRSLHAPQQHHQESHTLILSLKNRAAPYLPNMLEG